MPNHVSHSYSAAPMPTAIYVWLVRSEEVLDQPGSWRIRKWDIEPFPEANFELSQPRGPSGGNKPVVFCPVSEDGCTEEPVCPWPCKKLKNAALQGTTSASQSVAGGDHGGSATPAEAARKVAELTLENDALVRALRGVIAAEHQFTKDTGMELDDLVAEKVMAAKMMLRKYGKSSPPATTGGNK